MRDATLELADGRTLHFHDRGPPDGKPVFWLHGTPNIGPPPAPLFADADRLGLRWIGYDRPGYGGSSAQPGRNLASSAGDLIAIADRLGIEQFSVMGHSGGGAHALACAACLPHRVTAAISVAGLAPFGSDGLDWFAGMHPAGEAGLRAALAGRAAKLAYEKSAPEFDTTLFTDADWAALAGPWSWFDTVVGPATSSGPAGLVDDDIAYITPPGADYARIAAPVLLLHGEQDRIVPISHGEWLARQCPSAQLWRRPGNGHISILGAASDALDWLASIPHTRSA
ncbi:alpha/beta hydrolase [Massilia sp. G4R7]|uniref:Alpha/beta hydrolase n=1 Tax=Massilia phyllostachyos TaxID=2898585 RepID=A0ABS8Q559_9BURK|nr:alpha/beta hydrolase [Massilia phyllostachyos]MCD2516893.1 alpha/beta hydrolase [Massilia phyllostachyos]